MSVYTSIFKYLVFWTGILIVQGFEWGDQNNPVYFNKYLEWFTVCSFFFFFWSGLQGPKAYSLWGGVVPSPRIG